MRRRNWLIALNATAEFRPATLCSLARTAEDWMNIPRESIPGVALRLGVPAEALERAWSLQGEALRLATEETEAAARLGAHLIVLGDDDYPTALRHHPLPPPVLYCRGTLPEGPRIAVVGSRKMSPYGHDVCRLFARRLAEVGIVVVSGFAVGIDAVAHRAAMSVDDGKTIAVLGCGLDVDYPRGHQRLAHQIAQQGAVLSELPLGSPPLRWHFPIRNRIIAGLASGTLVVQAAERSGSLNTAHQALELGRDVYAVPGSIFDPLAAGPNRLIADGAGPALRPEDILESLSLSEQMVLFPSAKGASSGSRPAASAAPPTATDTQPPSTAPAPDGFAGRALAHLTGVAPQSAEELAQHLSADIDQVLATLLQLELDGWIRRWPGPRYGPGGG